MKTPASGKETSDTMLLPGCPQKARLSSRYNDLYNAHANGDTTRFEEIKEQAKKELAAFCAGEEVKKDHNPEWLRSVMRAGFHCAVEEYSEALTHEKAGFEHAQDQKRRWISALNISDELRRSGDAQEAVKWGEFALTLGPSHTMSYLTLGLALAAAGQLDQADKIFAKLIEIADFSSESDGLASRLIYERQFNEFNNLPSVKTLKLKIQAAGVAM
jgi:tetratricopeptide (TPR) repeat protein